MSSNIWPRTVPKRQRIMIITADENIIDQIEKSNNVSLLKQIVLPSEDDNSERSDKQSKLQPSHKKNKTKESSLICVVCGSSANGYNFGAIACESSARDGLPWDPSMHTRTFLQVLDSHSIPVMRLLSFFKQIPEFSQLNVDDKVTLIKYNLL
ncbi:unnamed protein product, partial [Rotaria sordida]